MLDVYTDGSFINGNYYYGYVILNKDGTILHESSGKGNNKEAVKFRNVAGEIKAVLMSMEYAIQNKLRLNILYDYEGVEFWATGQWKANNFYT